MAKQQQLKATQPASTIVCVATGPSLSLEQVEAIKASGFPVVAISDNYKLFPEAEYLYSCDSRWWAAHKEEIRGKFNGALVTIDPEAVKEIPGITLVPCVDFHQSRPGLSGVRGAITQGGSSGYQALHFAFNLGAERIILVGYDYGASGQGHWFGSHPGEMNVPSDFQTMLAALEVLAQDIGKAGVEVINCTAETAVTCFQRMPLADALDV